MPAPGPRLLALLLVTAAVGAGCTQDGGSPAPSPGPDAEDQPCNWAARFVDRDAYGILADIPPNASDVNVFHGPHRFGALPFENRSLEAVYGRLQLQRVLHANASPQVPNPTTDPGRWFGPVPAGLRIESDEDRVRSHGDDAFVAYVGQDVGATRAALVDFLGQVTDKNRSTRIAWADRALGNATPVEAGEDPRRVEVVFGNPDSDVVFRHPPGNLTLTSLYEDLAAEAPPLIHRAPGGLVAAFDDWWWVFELDYVAVLDGLSELRVDRHGRASFMVSDRGNLSPEDRGRRLADSYEALGLGSPPNATFEPVTWGPDCPEPTIPPSHG